MVVKRNLRLHRFFLLFLLLLFVGVAFATQASKSSLKKGSNSEYQTALNTLLTSQNMVFTRNEGQLETDVLYQAKGQHATASFTNNQIGFSLMRNAKLISSEDLPFGIEADVLNWTLSFVGGDPVQISPQNEVDQNVNYFGPGARNGAKIRQYKNLSYQSIYPNIDLKFYGTTKGELKYDFVVKPGANLGLIKMNYGGIDAVTRLESGALGIDTKWGKFIEDKPYSYQVIDGKEVEVQVNYQVDSTTNNVSFEIVGSYDPTYELIIDPIYVDWSTYFYGESISTTGFGGYNYILDVDIDDEDFVYITGMSWGQRFTSQLVGYDTAAGSGTTYNYQAFVCKITPDGDSLRYFTFIGGSSWEYSMNISVNSQHQTVISGLTYGSGFPTTPGAFDEDGRSCGSGWCYQGFVTKFTENGDSLVFSTYLTGSVYDGYGIDWIRGMQITDDGLVYLVGNTQSKDFPTTTGCYQDTYGGSSTGTGYSWYNMGDGFLTCLSSDGSSLVYSSYIGGAGNDVASDLFVNSDEEVYVVGKSSSGNFKTTPGASVFNTYIKGGSDGFIVKFKKGGKQIAFSKLMGGSGEESFEGIYANSDGEPYIIGHSNSSNFPVSSNAYQKKNAGGYDLVVIKMLSTGTNFKYSTYLGGGGDDGYSPYSYWFESMSITANVKEEAIISATTKSTDFPITADNIQSTNNSLSWYGKLTIAKLSYNGSKLMYGTYFGGSGGEFPGGIRAKKVGCVTYVLFAGNSYSGDYPTTEGVYRDSLKSGTSGWNWNGFVTKFRDTLYTEPIDLAFGDTIYECDRVFEILDAKNIGADFFWSDGSKDRAHIVQDSGLIWVRATYGCDTVSDSLQVILEHSPKIPVLGNDTTFCDAFPSHTLDAKNDTILRSYRWQDATTLQTFVANQPGTYFVDISTPHCGTKTDTIKLSLLQTPVALLPLDSILCDSVNLVLDAGNENNKVKYRWSTNDSVQSITVKDTGLYWLKVQNFCGSDSTSIRLDQYNLPVLSNLKDSVFCDNIGHLYSGGDYSNGEQYEWRRYDGSLFADLADVIVYQPVNMVLKAYNKCGSAFDSLEIGLLLTPNISLNDTILACDDVSEILTIPNQNTAVQYNWNTGATDSTLTAITKGRYWGSATNKCGADTANWFIRFSETPLVNLPADTILCNNAQLVLDVTQKDGSITYAWQDGTKLAQYTIKSAGLYTVTIENDCGSSSDEINVDYLKSPALNLGQDKIFCGGVTSTLFSIGLDDNAENYLWNSGSTSSEYTANNAGWHWASIANFCGDAQDSIFLKTSPYPIVNLGVDTILCGNFALNLDAKNPEMNFLWTPYGETTQTIQATEQRVYGVQVTNEDGCVSSDEFEIGSGCVSTYYVPNSFTPNYDGNNDVFKPQLVNYESYSLLIANRWGEVIFESKDANVGWDGTYQGQLVPAGTYMFTMRFITTENGAFVQKSGCL
ncbi:MAG: gliding motility-associated-like protein, partial [Bacteroidia bacterium]